MGKKPELNNITLPVYELCHKEIEDAKEEIPTEQDITTLAKAAIADDKDILMQLVYDGENHRITLPPNIMPLKLVDYGDIDGSVYFDYRIQSILNEQGNSIGGLIPDSTPDGQTYFTLVFTEGTYFSIGRIEYCFFNGNVSLNTYYLYHPVTSAGTKLYQHNISGDEEVVIISADSTPIGTNTSKSYAIGMNNVISMFLFSLNAFILDLYYQNNVWKVTKIDGTKEELGNITDTVTPL